jgi:uncharacterized protein (TIGR02302 family)
MAETPAERLFPHLPTPLARARWLVRAAMVTERLWPLVLPLLVIAAFFASIAWFGLFRMVPDWLRLGIVAISGLSALLAASRLRLYRGPTAGEVDRRIERANGLEHTPVLVQADRPSGHPDDFGGALWREHQRRMAERLATLAGDTPRPNIPERDPWAVRALAALIVVVALAFSTGPRGGGIMDAFHGYAINEAVPPRVDAWVTPPAYTDRAPIFLSGEGNSAVTRFQVPEGSQLSLRVTGGSGTETLEFTGTDGNTRTLEPQGPAAKASDEPDADKAAHVRQFSATLTADGTLSLKSGGVETRNWTFGIVPDKPPVIRFVGEPKHAVNGALELAYSVEDDYGPASAEASFEQVDPPAPGAHPLYKAPDMPLSLPRRGAKGHMAKTVKDLTAHPWAGTMVRLTLKAKDDAGHEAKSESKTLRMPERPFSNPLARAVIEQRRILALDANKKQRVLDMMDAITLRPEDTFANMAHFLAIASARTRLKMAETDDAYRDVVSYLWDIALGIEEGDLSDAEKRLRQAEQALQQALKEGAPDEEIKKLMKDLRQAMQNYLREFAERQQQNPNLAQQAPQNGRELRQSDLQRMLDQIENLAKSGARDEAQQLLSQLQEMMNNLQAGRSQQQGDQAQSEMRRQMDKLGEIMRRQQELMNKTFRLDRQQQGQRGDEGGEQQGQNGQPGEQGEQGGGGENPGMTPDELAEALRQLQQGQGKLRGDLGDLTKSLKELGIQPGEGFGEAGEAMGRAGKALGDAQGEEAVGEQGQALEALRRGAQNMMQQMQQAAQGDQGGSKEGGRQQNADRDPLGRPRATNGPDFGDSVKVPDEIDVQRARRILEAIRKRLGNALSPDLEKSYLERLLDLK